MKILFQIHSENAEATSGLHIIGEKIISIDTGQRHLET